MGDGVAQAHHILVIKLESTFTQFAMEFVNKSDIPGIVSIFDEACEERTIFKICSSISTSSTASLSLPIPNQDFWQKYLLEKWISFCLVVNLKVINFYVINELTFLLVVFAIIVQSFYSEQRELLSPVHNLLFEDLLDFSNK